MCRARLAPEEIAGRSDDELQDAIVEMMFGEQAAPEPELVELQSTVEGHRPRRALPEDAVLELDELEVTPRGGELGLHGVSLGVRPGEIMGIAGVDGNGQRELAEAIAGQRPAAAGDIRFRGVSIARPVGAPARAPGPALRQRRPPGRGHRGRCCRWA